MSVGVIRRIPAPIDAECRIYQGFPRLPRPDQSPFNEKKSSLSPYIPVCPRTPTGASAIRMHYPPAHAHHAHQPTFPRGVHGGRAQQGEAWGVVLHSVRSARWCTAVQVPGTGVRLYTGRRPRRAGPAAAAGTSATAVIYTLEGMGDQAASYAIRFLATAFPKARFLQGAQAGQVVAWATPKDHQEIKSLVDQMIQQPPPERARKVTVYGLKFISARDAMEVLKTAVPQAEFTVSDDDPQRLTAWACPAEHDTIAKIIQEIDLEGDAESGSRPWSTRSKAWTPAMPPCLAVPVPGIS